MFYKLIDLSDKENPRVLEGDTLMDLIEVLNENCFLLAGPSSLYSYNIKSCTWGDASDHPMYDVFKMLMLIGAI